MGTRKKMFTMSTLEERECVLKKGGVGSNSTISQLIDAQESATAEIKWLQAENTILQSKLNKNSMEPGSNGSLVEENSQLRAENTQLRKHNEDLKEQVIIDQRITNEKVDRLLKTFAP